MNLTQEEKDILLCAFDLVECPDCSYFYKCETVDEFNKNGEKLLIKLGVIENKKLYKNKARCKKCDDIIESTHRHDFKVCKCGSIAVDGGLDYSKRAYPSGDPEDWIEEIYEEVD